MNNANSVYLSEANLVLQRLQLDGDAVPIRGIKTHILNIASKEDILLDWLVLHYAKEHGEYYDYKIKKWADMIYVAVSQLLHEQKITLVGEAKNLKIKNVPRP